MIEVSVRSKVALLCGEMEKDLSPHLAQPFLEYINRGRRNYRSRRLIPVLGDSQKRPILSCNEYLAIVSP